MRSCPRSADEAGRYSPRCRSAAAAAKGQSASADEADRAENGEGRGEGHGSAGGRARRRDAEDQHRNRQRQHQQRHQQPAAAQRHRRRRADRADQRQRRRAGQQRRRHRGERRSSCCSIRPSTGAASISGRPVVTQCAAHLTRTTSSSGVAASGKRSSEPSSDIGLKQPVEAEQAGEQRRDPQHRRADAREQIGIGPDGERDDGHHHQEEHDAHGRRAADAAGDGDLAQEQRRAAASSWRCAPSASSRASGGRAAHGWRRRSCRRRARCSRIDSASALARARRARWSARRAATADDGDEQAGERDAPLLAGGENGDRRLATWASPTRSSARAGETRPPPPRNPAQKSRFSRAVSGVFSPSAWAR